MNAPRLRFREFGGEWEEKKLQDICNKIMDGTHFSPKSTEGTKKYLTSKNIRNTGLDISNCNYISDDEHQEIYKKCPVKLGDVLLTKDGANTGNCCINTLPEEFSLLSSVAVLSGKENLLNTLFLLQILQSCKGINTINNAMAGQAISRITLEKINKFKFTFPKFLEQTKIAHFLTAVDDKITQLTQKSELLARYKKGVMQQIFSQKLRFKDDDGREFPDWKEQELGDLCSTFKSGVGITSERINNQGEYPVYGGNGLRGYTDTYTHDGFFALIGRQGALCGNINRSVGKAYISEHAIAICANEKSDTEWLAQKLDLLNLNRLSESSAQPGLAVNKLVKLKLVTPSKPEQTKIANFLTALDDKLSHNKTQLNALKQYKQGLLQQLFV